MDDNQSEFINLQTDFGFKRAFGTLEFKACLIMLLNALLGDKVKVKDVTFLNKEILPGEEDGKRIVFDVYCTSALGSESKLLSQRQKKQMEENDTLDHHFIVEMQNVYTPPFEERMIYYGSRIVADQGKAGWDYELKPVIAIAIINFHLPSAPAQLISDYTFKDRITGHELSEKVRILFASLKSVPMNWSECKTEIERILFIIKNMDTMTTTSPAYAEGNYNAIFTAAKRKSLNDNEVVLYSQSLAKLRDMQRGIEYAAEVAAEKAAEKAAKRARVEGRAEGRAEGLVEGRAEAREEFLRSSIANMKAEKIEDGRICKILSISEEEFALYS